MDESRHILIVEDDLDLAEMLTEFFSSQGYQASSSAWGQEALLMAAKAPPDLVVLDIHLPDIDGYEVCQRLRDNRNTQGLPVIFLTEKRDRTARLHGLELGVVDYITKPFDPEELILRVRNTLQRATRHPLNNSVTGLPESTLSTERLAALLESEDWGALAVRISGLNTFREQYGFVSSDDVLRAVSLMINNAIREAGTEGDFAGHLDEHSFLVTTSSAQIDRVRERVATRIGQSIEFFYPLRDRLLTSETPVIDRLRIDISLKTHDDGPFATVDALKAALSASAPEPAGPANASELEDVVEPDELVIIDSAADSVEAEVIFEANEALEVDVETTAGLVEVDAGAAEADEDAPEPDVSPDSAEDNEKPA